MPSVRALTAVSQAERMWSSAPMNFPEESTKFCPDCLTAVWNTVSRLRMRKVPDSLASISVPRLKYSSQVRMAAASASGSWGSPSRSNTSNR